HCVPHGRPAGRDCRQCVRADRRRPLRSRPSQGPAIRDFWRAGDLALQRRAAVLCAAADHSAQIGSTRLKGRSNMQRCLGLLLLIVTVFATGDAALAQSAYPTRPVKIICGFPAGTSLDIVTRIYAQKLEERLGQTFVVENRGGASGNLATEAVMRSEADGYTLLSAGITQAISMSLFKKVNF